MHEQATNDTSPRPVQDFTWKSRATYGSDSCGSWFGWFLDAGQFLVRAASVSFDCNVSCALSLELNTFANVLQCFAVTKFSKMSSRYWCKVTDQMVWASVRARHEFGWQSIYEVGNLQVGGVVVGVELPSNSSWSMAQRAQVQELVDGMWLACVLTGKGLQGFTSNNEIEGVSMYMTMLTELMEVWCLLVTFIGLGWDSGEGSNLTARTQVRG